MSSPTAFPELDLDLIIGVAQGALIDVAGRDNLYLKPDTITQAARNRALRGVRAIEAFIRRVLILLALQFEHDIKVDITPRPRPKNWPKPKQRVLTDGPGSLRVFPDERNRPQDFKRLSQQASDAALLAPAPTGPLPSAPILQRLERANLILQTIEARAQRLAFALARRRHGPLTPPLPNQLPTRMGTEFSSIYPTLGIAVYRRSRERPPAQRPRPPPPPRAVFL